MNDRYIVVHSSSVSEIEKKVNAKLNEGYILAGNLFYTGTVYIQTMVK